MASITLAPGWSMKKFPNSKFIAQETASMQSNVYISLMETPCWDFKMSLPYLEGRMDDPNSDVSALLGLFINARGGAGNFTYFDNDDHQVTNYTFGTGDGTSQVFQLTRPFQSGFEWVQNVVGTPTIFINGTPTTLYTIDGKGVVTFNTAPASAAVLAWSGNFQYLLRFKNDSLQDLTMFFKDSWLIDELEFESVIR
jgi:hypothetical protein